MTVTLTQLGPSCGPSLLGEVQNAQMVPRNTSWVLVSGLEAVQISETILNGPFVCWAFLHLTITTNV